MRLIAIGSMNPVKVGAARSVIATVWPQADVRGVDVSSGVADQPFGDDETIRGARTRAATARTAISADLGIGIEGGVVDVPGGGLRTCAWAAAVDATGRSAVGGSLAMPLPTRVAALI